MTKLPVRSNLILLALLHQADSIRARDHETFDRLRREAQEPERSLGLLLDDLNESWAKGRSGP